MPHAMTATAPQADLQLELHLDGPPSLRLGGRVLTTATRKALALAVLAALDGGLRRQRAAELLWPDADPAAARRNLRRDLFRLRQQGLPLADGARDTLQLHAVLHWPPASPLAPRWLDALDEVAGAELSHWVDGQRARLQRQWVDHLVAQARRHEQRAADAAALQAWQAVLADGAGGPDHAEARAAVQRLQPPALSDAAPPLPAAPLAAAPGGPWRVPFVGRAAELQAIGQALDQGRVVLVDGAPGVGKTRLAQEALAARGGVLVLRCRPEDTAVPYASALRGLQALREAAPDVVLPPWVRRALGLLVPAWAAGGTPDADPLASTRLLPAWRAALLLLADGNFGGLVIDDWQWADEASQALFEPSADAAALPCLVLHRSGELPLPLLQRRRRWLDSGLALAVRVPPLAADDARALLQGLGGEGVDTADLVQRGAGNPLILIETLRHVQQRGSLAVPATVHELIVARARALGPAVRRVLEVASVAGDDWPLPALAAAAGLDELATAQALEHATVAELLLFDHAGRHRFVHDLVAQALADSLSAVRLAALHGQWAAALAAAGAEPGRVARHLDQAGRAADAAPWHLRAAQVARQRQAWAAVRDASGAALAGSDDAALRLQAQLLRAEALRRMAELPAAEATLDAALADAVRVGPAAVIDLDLHRAELLANTGRAEQALAVLDALHGDPALHDAQRWRLQLERAGALSFLGRHAESLPMLRQALAQLPTSAVAERQRALNMVSRSAYWAGELDECRTRVQQMLALARSLGDEGTVAAAWFRLGALDREQGHVDDAVRQLQAAADAARRVGHVELLRSALSTLATVRIDQMRLDDAEALVHEGEQAAPYWDSPLLEDVFDERRFLLHVMRGQVDAAWAVWQRSLQRMQTLNHLHFHSATLVQGIGLALLTLDVSRARSLLDAAQALHAGADSLHARELVVHEACVLQAEGRAAQALQRVEDWLAQPHDRRMEEIARAHGAAALAAIELGQLDTAARHLAGADAVPGLPLNQQAERLAAHLHHARAGGEALAPALQAARAWLDQGARPLLSAALLRRALAQVDQGSR